jgi:Mrp family chromosome partitioning ATPase
MKQVMSNSGRPRWVVTTAPRCYLRSKAADGSQHLLPIAPTMLFLGMREADEPDTAARDAAIELGSVLDRPVLLLDVSAHEGAQHAYFNACGALLAQPGQRQPPAGQAAFQFHPVRDSMLWVSSLVPPQAAQDESFWAGQWACWPATRQRLLALFGAIVIAAPSVMRSPRGLALAALAEATILVLRDGNEVAQRARSLRDQVRQCAGHPVGVVMTGCRERASWDDPALAPAAW